MIKKSKLYTCVHDATEQYKKNFDISDRDHPDEGPSLETSKTVFFYIFQVIGLSTQVCRAIYTLAPSIQNREK